RRVGGLPCVKVLDFGIAKVTASPAPSLTRTSVAMGTALYAAPEQLMSAKSVDRRCDIWSLGVTLYELLTRRTPFEAEDFAALVGAILTQPPTPILNRRHDLPSPLAAVIDRTLAKDREARPRNVLELAEELAPFGSGETARSMQAIRQIV